MLNNKINYLKTIKATDFTPAKIITFDIETILKDNIHIPYLYSMFDGTEVLSWFTLTPDLLFKELFKRKYYGYQIYAHNLSKFDLIFIFKFLGELSFIHKVKIWRRDEKTILIKISNKSANISLTIKDSLLLLQSSLDSLAKNFQVETLKGNEPVLIEDITNSQGSDFYIMNDLSHYSKEVLKLNNYLIWKELVKKYCEQDCIALYQVLVKFRELVYNEFNLLIDTYPTTPSLAFGIFRSKYLKDETIAILDSKMDSFIRKSFTGGSTDFIIPYGLNIYCYDVNSLYPSVMCYKDFPIGNGIKFSKFNDVPEDSFWIGRVEVSTKKDLHIPYLQIHYNNRTISPNGNFEMVITSVEYLSALEDYNFKILDGYYFKKDNLFFSYVTDLYNLRLQYPKSDPMNLIAKLLMNSLYGRFGMKNEINNSSFVRDIELKEILKVNPAINVIDLNDDLNFIQESELNAENKSNVAIASAVTSYARVHMLSLKKYCTNNNIKIFYFDTDSLFTDKPLPPSFISNNLGDLKLEYIFKEAYKFQI